MIPIVPKHLREKERTEPPKEKLYSYHEVEDIICRAMSDLRFTEIIRRNRIEIGCDFDCKEKGLIVIIRQGNEVVRMPLRFER